MKKKEKPGALSPEMPTSLPLQKKLTSNVLLYFVLRFAVLFLLFEVCYFNDYCYNHIFLPVNNLFATIASKSLTLLGIPTKHTGDTIANATFSISVKQGCDSMEAMAIFICGVVAFPSKLRIKLYGLLIGCFTILFMNLIRLIHLFWIGLNHHDLFDLFHLEIWQGLFIILSIVLWLLWVVRAVKPTKIKGND